MRLLITIIVLGSIGMYLSPALGVLIVVLFFVRFNPSKRIVRRASRDVLSAQYKRIR